MYRREYPDVPGLFDARFSEYNRPNLFREFQTSWLIHSIGAIMVLSGAWLLFWNEGRAVQTSVSLAEGLRDVTVPETLSVVFQENNGKLVLVADQLAVPDPLRDDMYGISVHAAKLRKVVQVYQWQEKEDRQSSNEPRSEHDTHVEKTYSYDTDWFDHHIDSSNFASTLGHHNPHKDSWPAESSLSQNPRVKIGDFLLGKELQEKFNDFTPFTSDEKPGVEGVKIHAGLYYHAKNVWRPEVGDWRVQFSYAGKQGEEFTVVAKQAGRELRPYSTEAGDELVILHTGLKSPDEVFRSEQYANRTTTWIYRLAGWFVTFLGLNCLGTLLQLLLDTYPFLRTVLTLGVTSINFSVSVSLTLLIIGLGWIWYRPFVGLAFLTLGLLPYIIPVSRIVVEQRRNQWNSR